MHLRGMCTRFRPNWPRIQSGVPGRLRVGQVHLVTMIVSMNVAEAKAKLSELLDAASAGDEVVIAKAGRPVVRLVPITEPPRRELGFLSLNIDDSLFDPLTDTELADWE